MNILRKVTMKRNVWARVALFAVVASLGFGCAEFNHARVRHRANSLYTFLYPEGSEHADAPTIPTLSLPLRVGVAFVPTQTNGRPDEDVEFTETHKAALLKKVSDQFKSYPFVRNIEIIPSAYLTPRGGFANIAQLKSMYDLDVMALLSYDQAQFTDEGMLSLTYWTIVGAYVVPGEHNDTRTMIDAAVYDIRSRKLLFRAPGLSTVKASATLMDSDEELRHNSEQGFEEAATNLVVELKAQLADFQERVKSSPQEYKVVRKPGYTGEGALSPLELGLVACAGIGLAFAQKKEPK
jgi:rhombotail lipoprotein